MDGIHVSLEAMDSASFSEYLQFAIPSYARDNVESGRWDKSDALERSKKVYAHLLPEGLNSPDDHLFNIIESATNQNVGYIWVKIETHFGVKSAFIYGVGTFEGYRRKGYAKSALRCIETVASDLGATSLGLHVFSHNSAAQSLYSSMGYHVVSHNMKKSLVS
ncbi:GNAT family N-acetyltransferase [Enterovibrio norvegicus FF-33]|uniref:GNAT family N-acetyltransferase n=1 Tax=Enterovibrio norvegicus TaxID=188144 RepID=UPI0002FD9B1C|nr:GNAT family N-acetyltransferase [Enterovibrio norvegicus]OEE67591.1 GNAT family N-acetyltransferase [Enterovibrio norvegicus FF-33]